MLTGWALRSTPLFCLSLQLVFGCSEPVGAPELGVSAQPVIYGVDGRHEYFEATDVEMRRLTEEATVALMPQSVIELDARGALTGPTWRDQAGLCDGEPFADQPSLARCTGVLVSDDLVLTAAHCLNLVPCEQMALVFGFYYEAANQLRPVGPNDVAACAEVVARELSAKDSTSKVDYAWIRLKTPRPSGATAIVDERPVPVDANAWLSSVSFGGGIPAKIEIGARVWDPRPDSLDYFVTSFDNFHGASGAAVYDANYRVIGIAARGQPDFWITEAGCRASAHESESAAGEQITYAHRALDGLCRTLDNEHALCAGRAPVTEAGCSLGRSRGSGKLGFGVLLLLVTSALRRRRSPLR